MAEAVLGESGFGSESMSGQQIYQNFVNAKGPAKLMEAQDHLTRVMSTYQDRVRRIASLAVLMEEGWSGDAGEAARCSAGPLAVAHDDAAMRMVQASRLIEGQSQAFYDTRNRVVPVPEIPKAPSFLDNVIALGSASTGYRDKVVQSLVAARQNVNAMDAWSGTSADNGSRMPSSYGSLDPGGLDVTVASSAAPSVGGGGARVVPGGGGAGGGGVVRSLVGGSGHAVVGGGYVSSAPVVGASVSGLSAGPARVTMPDRYVPPVGVGSIPVGPIGEASGGGCGGWGPVSGVFGSDSSSIGGRGGSGSPMGGSGRAVDRFSGGVSGEKALGAGNRGGAGTPGTSHAVGEPTGRAGSAGRPGASGMGAGTHGGRGNGEEDAEHDRKYILDDDEPFHLATEGERLIDPTTGLPVAPPVIG